MLPEIMLSCSGSRYPVNIQPIHISSSTNESHSDTFKAHQIRTALAQSLLTKMVDKSFMGLGDDFKYLPGCNDVSTFEVCHTFTELSGQ